MGGEPAFRETAAYKLANGISTHHPVVNTWILSLENHDCRRQAETIAYTGLYAGRTTTRECDFQSCLTFNEYAADSHVHR